MPTESSPQKEKATTRKDGGRPTLMGEPTPRIPDPPGSLDCR